MPKGDFLEKSPKNILYIYDKKKSKIVYSFCLDRGPTQKASIL